MKLLTTLTLISAIATAAFADDQQLANRIAIQRTSANSVSVALLANGQSVAAPAAVADKSLSQQPNGHGQSASVYR